MSEKPQVLKVGLLSAQVCVPTEWTDDQVKAFAEREAPRGTTNGWFVRKQGDERLLGCDERVPCGDPGRRQSGFVHIMLDA